MDFEHDGRKIESAVNTWVSDKTNNMIEELLPEKSLEPGDRLIIVAAIYFKGLCVGAIPTVRGFVGIFPIKRRNQSHQRVLLVPRGP